MKFCQYFLPILLLIILFLFCAPGLTPPLDANFDNRYEVSASITLPLRTDKFPNNQSLIHDTISTLQSYFMYYPAFTNSIGCFYFFQRLQLGFGLAGLYNKFMIIKPNNYSYFSLNNVTVTQYFYCSAYMGRLHEGSMLNADFGLLFGTPFSNYFSITSGLGLRALRSLYLPYHQQGIYFTLINKSVYGLLNAIIQTKLNQSLIIGIELPYDFTEYYSFEEVNVFNRPINHINLINPLFRITYLFKFNRFKSK